MPVIYRVTNLDDAPVRFFAKKGEANKARTASKRATGTSPGELEMLRLTGRDDLVALLNNPSGSEPEEDDAANEFLG